uniref:Uncharacterized protein n=1 Tax=Anguilla anguilla TaxID=7936 RepID=A0A0E9V6T9_ANGAN
MLRGAEGARRRSGTPVRYLARR